MALCKCMRCIAAAMNCVVCGKTFHSERGLISHTEAVHGRDNVHRGICAWESSRRQEGAVTVGEATEHNQVWDEEGVDYSYEYSAQLWKCGHCNKTSKQVRDILAHLKGGAHEVPRYHCSDCNKKFKSMQALQSHFESTGHSPQQQRLTSVARDDLRSTQLLIGNGPPPAEGKLMFDGSPNGASWVLYDHRGKEIDCGRASHSGTSNQGEYTGLILGLQAAIKWMMKRLLVQGDSELVINQMNGVYRTLHPNMKPLHELARQLILNFQTITFEHVLRQFNQRADELCRQY